MTSNTLLNRPRGISLIGGGLIGSAYLILTIPFLIDIDKLLRTSPSIFIEYTVLAAVCFFFGIGILKGLNWLRILFWLALISFSLIIYSDSQNITLIIVSIIGSILLFNEKSNTFFKNRKAMPSEQQMKNKTVDNNERIAGIDEF